MLFAPDLSGIESYRIKPAVPAPFLECRIKVHSHSPRAVSALAVRRFVSNAPGRGPIATRASCFPRSSQ
ncbi:protein of unknown function [Methylorubrum extorquens]|uniref:Uncharacterized protein n=1 Tax=Methylorubrum extorquens TaxID=408 RepID=A0A2N9AYT6_METEX|nr:protein of unknown function [Methylorubrum extorquens]